MKIFYSKPRKVKGTPFWNRVKMVRSKRNPILNDNFDQYSKNRKRWSNIFPF